MAARHLLTRQRLAVVGTGISGLVAASILQRRHDVTVFEAADYVGGHTNTIDVQWQGQHYPVDTGFIVFNDRTYPNFERLLQRLGVASKPTDMSFSVHCDRTGLEYNGSSLNQMFAQRRNLLRPAFYRMIRDILRFYREAPALLEGDEGRADLDLTLGRYLEQNRYSPMFVEQHIVPMGAAVWSADPRQMMDFPAVYFIRFFHNHGMLSVRDRPTWRVVEGGSNGYVPELIRPFADRIRLNSPITALRRTANGVALTVAGCDPQHFDGAVLACHSDQALRILADATKDEREALSATPYQKNEAVLHVDERLMPKRRRAWAAWNYHVDRETTGRVAVTYNMNILQGIDAPVQFCVTLNRTAAIDPDKVLRRITYHHPVYTTASVAAQQRHSEVSGVHRVWFCGAYWGYGFHEDGVNSGLAVCRQFGMGLDEGELAA